MGDGQDGSERWTRSGLGFYDTRNVLLNELFKGTSYYREIEQLNVLTF